MPGIKQRVLEGVLGVLEGSEHPVAVHLQLSAVRLGQLSERIAVPGPSPVDQVGCHHSTVASRLSLSRVHISIDPGRAANWAVGARPLCRRRGIYLIDGSEGWEHPEREGEPEMMLKDKVAVIYGAGGGIGGAVARAFASDGANVFLTGRNLAPVEVVAKEIVAAGGSAQAAEVDALDEQAVDAHLQSVIDQAGRVDISFNAIGIPDAKLLGVPLTELDVEQFSLPIATHATSYFLTARLAARQNDREQVGGDHDRHRAPLADGHPARGRLRSGAGGQGVAHSGSLRGARTSRNSRGRSAAERHA